MIFLKMTLYFCCHSKIYNFELGDQFYSQLVSGVSFWFYIWCRTLQLTIQGKYQYFEQLIKISNSCQLYLSLSFKFLKICQYCICMRTWQGIYGKLWPEPKAVPFGAGLIFPYNPCLVLIWTLSQSNKYFFLV